MLDLVINTTTCTHCGACVADCPARIIDLVDGIPVIASDKEASCYKCQHCLAICPTGALSILGVKPTSCRPLAGAFPEPDRLEGLIRGRRSIRRYRPENVPAELMQRLLDVAWQAPNGVNARDVLFTLLDDRAKVAALRERVMAGLGAMARQENLPEGMEFFANFVKLWEEKGVDIIFRDAPHLIIATAPRTAASPVPDCLISLTCFDLFAQSLGVGTVWNGLAKWALFDILPGMRESLGIPADHAIGYAMSFGLPAVRFARTIDHGPARVNRVP